MGTECYKEMKFEIQTSTKGHLKDKDQRIFLKGENVIIMRGKIDAFTLLSAETNWKLLHESIVEELFAKMAAADQAGVVRKNNTVLHQ